MKLPLYLLIAAGCAADVRAQSTTIVEFQASVNGGPFLTGSQGAHPGDSIEVRAAVTLTNPAVNILGLASMNMIPTITNWASDSMEFWAIVPDTDIWGHFPPGGPGAHFPDHGRMAPFAASSATSIPTPVLVGTTMNIHGSNANRIAIGQLNRNSSIDGDGSNFFNSGFSQVIVFTYGIQLNSTNLSSRSLSLGVDSPPFTASWYTNPTGSAVNIPLIITNSTLEVTPVPEPTALAALAAGFLLAPRRKRN